MRSTSLRRSKNGFENNDEPYDIDAIAKQYDLSYPLERRFLNRVPRRSLKGPVKLTYLFYARK